MIRCFNSFQKVFLQFVVIYSLFDARIMKVYKLTNVVKILTWFLVVGLFIIILSVIKFRPRNPHILPQKMLSSGAPHEVKRKPLNELEELKHLLQANEHKNWSLDANCAPYPRLSDLRIESVQYQYTMGGNVSYFLFGAYYDRRNAMENPPSVAILAMIDNIVGPYAPAFCQVWYEGSNRPDIVEMTQQKTGWYKEWGTAEDLVYPVLMSCPLKDSPRSYRVPQLVSLVFTDRCARPTNGLRVVYEAPTRKHNTRFAVCVKDLQFPKQDMSDRFIEWLELMRILGAERVTAYDLGGDYLLPQTRRTLQHYMQQDGLVQVRAHTLHNGHPKPSLHVGLSKPLNEVLMYTDCFYRNMYEFDYIGVFDVDEVIMPLGNLNNWSALIELLEKNTTHPDESNNDCKARVSYCFRNVYYPRELALDERAPATFYMLQHVHRVAEHLDSMMAIKCLHSTQYVVTIHNHFPFSWSGCCGPYDVSTAIGQMQHYREPDIKETLVEPPPVRDDNIWRFKDQLISNVMGKHRELGLPFP